MVALQPDIMRKAMAAAGALQQEGTLRAAYVFGSHVDGRADRWSDIDVAAFMDGVECLSSWQRACLVARVQKAVGFDVEPHLFPASALSAPEFGSFAAYVLANGIPLETV